MEIPESHTQKEYLNTIEIENDIIDSDRLELFAKTNYKYFLEVANKIYKVNESFYIETVIPLIQKYEKKREEFNKSPDIPTYRKYGWGWIILVSFYAKGLERYMHSDFGSIGILFFAIPLLLLYFFVRKKLLNKRHEAKGSYGNIYSASFVAGIIVIIPIQILAIISIYGLNAIQEKGNIKEITEYRLKFNDTIKTFGEEKAKIVDRLNKEISNIDDPNFSTDNLIQLLDNGIDLEKKALLSIDNFKFFLNTNIYLKNQRINLKNYNRILESTSDILRINIQATTNLKYYYETKDTLYFNNYKELFNSTELRKNDFKISTKELLNYNFDD